MDKHFIEEVIEWDVENWKHALLFWNDVIQATTENENKGLELGGRRGGPSLWLASKGYDVVCSDLENPQENAKLLHDKYKTSGVISYEAISATNIPYENHFDVIVMKSIIGGVSHSGQDELQKKVIDECLKALKPGGQLLFAENLDASVLHRFARKRFVKWGSAWNYLKYKNIPNLFTDWKSLKFETVGFFAAFGRSENQRRMLGKIDRFFHPILPKKIKYIVYGVAVKK